MLKIGKVKLDTAPNELNIIWMSDKSFNERIDIVENLEAYSDVDTSECVVSYIKDNVEHCYGDVSIITKFMRIKQESTFLHVAEKRDTSVEDGKFVLTITKEAEGTGIKYVRRMVNGNIDYEEFVTTEGVIRIDRVENTAYVSSDRPINWEEYHSYGTVSGITNAKTVKVDQAEFRPFEELLRIYPEVSHVLNNDYVVIDSYEQAEERLQMWIDSKEQLKSFDIESFHTVWHPTSDNRITGVFLGYGTKWSTYFPFRQQNFKYNLPIEFLRRIFDAINNQPPAPEVLILAHNVLFEIEGFYQEFREFVRFDIDTYLLGVLVDPLLKKGSHTLKNLASKVDNNFYLTLQQIFIGPVKFNVLTEDIVKLYGCPDATSPAKIYPYLMQRLPKDELFVLQLHMQLPVIKAMNEFYGIRMDQKRLDTLIEEEEYKVMLLGDLFRKTHKTSRNINSNDVLKDILYNKLRCPVEVRTDKGEPSTSKYARDRIIELGAKKIGENDPIPKDVLDKNGKVIIEGKKLAANKYPSLIIYQKYKECEKELGALRRLKNKSADGRFLFYINCVGAGSNRQTSDAHQFSDTMKSCALADSPYHGLVSCDYKQVELRILAGDAGQEDLIELEKDAGVDIHRAILSIIQKKPMWEISEEDRKAGKSVNFGVVYMMSEYGLARRDFGPGFTKEQLNIEKNKIMDFYNGLPKIKKKLKENEEMLLKHGYIKTKFGYYRYFPQLLDPTIDKKAKQRAIRSGNNTPVQGYGAQLLKICEVKVWNYIKSKGWDKEKCYDGVWLPQVRMILPIHDEILLSYDKEIPKEEIILMFKECMELDIDGMPPFFAAPAFINNWYDGKNPVFEVDIPFRDKVVEEYKKGNFLLTGHDYVKTLTDYRNEELGEYMEGLIAQYKTPEEVAKHVRHDSLTHTLIEVMIQDKKERGKMTHLERIEEATRRYFEQRKNNNLNTITIIPEEKDENESFMELDEWVTSYTQIDANGDLIIEAVEGMEDDTSLTDVVVGDEDEASVLELAPASNVIYLMSECLVDLTGLVDTPRGERINQGIQQLSRPEGFYKVVYVMGERLFKTKLRVDYIPEELEKLFDESNDILEGISYGQPGEENRS